MECDVCMLHFDSEERRPKVLPCGHTYCISCLRQLPAKQCPVDKKVFQLDNLADNYKLLTVAASSLLPPVRFWCISCEKEATGHCVDRHDIRSVTAQRTKASEPLLSELDKGEEALAALGGVLDKEAVNRQADSCTVRLMQERVRLATARNLLQDAVGAEASVWEQATQAAVQSELSQSAAQLTNDIFDPSTSWTVRGAAGGVVAWAGEMRPSENAAARLLLCGLACSGGLRAPVQQPDKQPNQQQEPTQVRKRVDNSENAWQWQGVSGRLPASATSRISTFFKARRGIMTPLGQGDRIAAATSAKDFSGAHAARPAYELRRGLIVGSAAAGRAPPEGPAAGVAAAAAPGHGPGDATARGPLQRDGAGAADGSRNRFYFTETEN